MTMKHHIGRFAALTLLTLTAFGSSQPRAIYCRIHQTDAFYEKVTNPRTPECTYYFSHGYGKNKHTLVTPCSSR